MRRPNYAALTWYPVLAVGISMIAFIMIKTGRDAVFFQREGFRQLPVAYIWIAIAAVPAAMMHLGALNRWGARKTRTVLFYLTAALFLLFFPVAVAGSRLWMTVLFVSVPTIFAAVFAGAWLLAGDLLEGADPGLLRQAYSRIGAASMVGGIVGGVLAKGITALLHPQFLFAGGAFFLVAAGLFVARAHRDNPPGNYSAFASSDDEADTSNNSRQSLLFREKYFRVLVCISAVATLAALFIDFQFYAAATVTGNNNASFFADFYVIVNAASLVIQLLVAPRLQAKLGVVGALLLLPYALLGGSGLFNIWTFLHARTLLKVAEGGLKSSIHRSMWEQVYLPISRKVRDIAKTVVDGAVARVAEGVGSVLILTWLYFNPQPPAQLDFTWLTWATMVTLALWIVLTRYFGKLGCADINPTETLIRLPDG